MFPDWVEALDGVARGDQWAVVTQRNARDIIRELDRMGQLQAEIERLREIADTQQRENS